MQTHLDATILLGRYSVLAVFLFSRNSTNFIEQLDNTDDKNTLAYSPIYVWKLIQPHIYNIKIGFQQFKITEIVQFF